MRKLIVLTFVTLDGIMQAPGGPQEDPSGEFTHGGWTVPHFDEFLGQEMGAQMAGEYDLLLGRKTYEIFAGYWPQHTTDWPQVSRITKYVVSRTLQNPAWENTVVLEDEASLKKLKEQGDRDLQVHGSSNLIQTLLQLDLIDELWLKIFPIVLGKGKRLFGEGTVPAAFELMESKTSPKGVILAKYKRAGEVETGSF